MKLNPPTPLSPSPHSRSGDQRGPPLDGFCEGGRPSRCAARWVSVHGWVHRGGGGRALCQEGDWKGFEGGAGSTWVESVKCAHGIGLPVSGVVLGTGTGTRSDSAAQFLQC